MKNRNLALLIGGIAMLGVVIFYLINLNTSNKTVEPEKVVPPGSFFPEQNISRVPGTINSRSGAGYTVAPLITNTDTSLVTEDFYSNSTNPNDYDIFYYELQGNIMILLYNEDLSFTRSLAERQLLEVLPYSESEFCDMEIIVQTNEYVSVEFSGRNLGLSFCPGSLTL